MSSLEHRERLIEEFIACWEKLDGFNVIANLDDTVSNFSTGETNELDEKWRPLLQESSHDMLDSLYAKLPARFPPLYEQLVLMYRWPEVDLGSYRLLGNPPGPDLSGLLQNILRDKFLSTFLLKNGYMPFGKGPDMDYDPVCFDLASHKKNREFTIVKVDHEETLCNERIKVVAELAPTFEQLVRNTIEAARHA
jgi:hypothetical protein